MRVANTLIAVAILAAACGGKTSTTAPELAPLPAYEPGAGPGSPLLAGSEPAPVADAELTGRAAELLRGLARELDTEGGAATDCARIGDRVGAFALRERPALDALRRDLSRLSAAERGAIEAELSRRARAALDAIRVASEACPDAAWDLF